MTITLSRTSINDAIMLAEVTYPKWKTTQGHYSNLYNSHVKGKVGEIAAEEGTERLLLYQMNEHILQHVGSEMRSGLQDGLKR